MKFVRTLVGVLGLIGGVAHAEHPPVFIAQVEHVPDLSQVAVAVDPAAGDAYCAPAAVSNSLCFLARNGYPRLVEESGSDSEAQTALARTLASPEFMNTSPTSGTSKEALLAGVRDYVEGRGYRIRSAEYRGIEIYYKQSETSPSTVPDIEILKSKLFTGAAVWLQVGWYRRVGSDYRKTGGHWVTLTGYGADASGTLEPAILIVRDPSPRSGDAPSSQYLRLRAINDGRIIGWGLPQPAAGFCEVIDGIARPDGADTTIVEGVALVELAPP